jgi:hypothetical protein
MTRLAVIWVALVAACEPRLPPRALPELVKPEPPALIRVPEMMLVAGETLAWNVNAKGFTIGRAEWFVDEHEVRTRFATNRLASAFAKVRHELATLVGVEGARSATDVVELDGATTRVQTMFARGRYTLSGANSAGGVIPGGNFGHTLHTALATVRAWAEPDARPGFLYVLHAGDLFRLDFARPFVEDFHGIPTLRVECRITQPEQISITIWLRASDERTPIRFEITSGEVKLTAELLATDA